MTCTTAAKRLRVGGPGLVLGLMASLAVTGVASASTFTASDTNTFVQAVSAANTNPGPDTINLVHGGPQGVYAPTATVQITDDVSIVNTTAFPAKFDGSAVQPFPSDFIVVDAGKKLTLDGVIVTGGGGSGYAGLNVFGELSLANSTVSGNNGPGVVVEPGATGTITNSTLNDGLDFGLIAQGSATVVNSTIAKNKNGGLDASGNVSLVNTIVAKNGFSDCTQVVATSIKSLDGDRSCGVQLTGDPQFNGSATLANGGVTPTLALKGTSPAVNAGDNANCPTHDQRGVARNDGACDVGAYEFVDTTAPVLSLPADQTAEATGPGGAAVSYSATATDPDDTASVQCTPASGSTFPIGTTPVNCTATDTHNNTTRGSFNVKVQDTTAPSITGVPADKTVNSPGGPVTVTYDQPTATDAVDGTVAVSCDPASGSSFPVGDTTVTCTATDAHGNTATRTFKVSVVTDSTPPVIGSAPDVTATATSPAGATVDYTTPSATDNRDGAVPVTCAPASGSTFPIGQTTVTCSATDSSGNTATKSFKVTVTRVPTSIAAGSVLSGGLSSVSATLKAGSTPLAGRTVTFRAGSAALCSATTNASGVARCSYNVLSLLNVVLALGYDASYAGDAVYAPASGHGSLL